VAGRRLATSGGPAAPPWSPGVPGLQAGLQGNGQRGVQADPLAGQQLAVDRLGPQGMAEHVPGAARLGQQQLLVDRRVQALQQLLVVDAGDRGQRRLGDARAGAAAGQQQFLGEERVALRTRVEVVDQPGGRVGAEQAGELLGHLGAGEAGQLQPLHPAVAGQLTEQPAQRVQPVQFVVAEGAHQQHPTGAEVGGQVGEQVAGGAVGPVQVLQHPQHGRLRRQALHHPKQQREQPPLTGARDGGADGGLAGPGEVGQQPAQLMAGGTGDRLQLGRVQVVSEAAQRLDDRRERQPLLAQRRTAAAQHPHALPVGGGGELLGQPGLAHPGLPAVHRHQRPTGSGERQQLAQPRQLGGAADEPPCGGLVGHGGPSIARAGAEQERARR
jgi:hypothetical protein